jgi:hypothetical protein
LWCNETRRRTDLTAIYQRPSSPGLIALAAHNEAVAYNRIRRLNLSTADTIELNEVMPPAYDPNGLRPPSYRSPAPSFKTVASVRGGPLRSALSLVSVAEQSRGEGSVEAEHVASERLAAGGQSMVAAELLNAESDERTRVQGTSGGVHWP